MNLGTELMVNISLCNVSPYDVVEAVAGWTDVDRINHEWSSGFVIRTREGWQYIVTKRNQKLRSTRTVNRHFGEEPLFLYERARNWNFNKEELNANLPLAKVQAKYPSTDRKSGGEACARPVVRIQAPQPGA